MVSQAQLKVSLLCGGSPHFENTIPKSFLKYSSAAALSLQAEGKENCTEVEKLKVGLLMMKLNNLKHHNGEFRCLKCLELISLISKKVSPS